MKVSTCVIGTLVRVCVSLARPLRPFLTINATGSEATKVNFGSSQ